MPPTSKNMPLGLAAFCLILLIAISIFPAQSPWAALKQPPSGIAPAGDVISAGHLGREIGNVELMIHFYHDLLGFGLMGSRDQPRSFFVTGPDGFWAEFMDHGVKKKP